MLLALALVATACGVGGPPEALASFEMSSLVLNPGSSAAGFVDIGETRVTYVAVTPEGFTQGDTAPVLLAFPPGAQDLSVTQSTIDRVYMQEALRLGWVVVSPVSPDGTLFFQGAEDVLPSFANWIEQWVTPEGGALHVAGMSNGGLSSWRFAAQNPDRVQSLITFPGFPSSGSDRDAMENLTDIPIRLYVGGNDAAWLEPMQETSTDMAILGGRLSLEIFPGENHIVESTYDGRIVFEQLESFR